MLAVLSAVFAAIANIMARTLLKNVRSRDILAINFATIAGILLVFSPFFYHFMVNPRMVGLVVLVGLIDMAANFFYFKAFEKTEASVATPILSLAPGFTFLFGWLFLGDVVSAKTFALTVAIILLIVLFSADFRHFKHFRVATLLPALMASFLFGVSAIPSKVLLTGGDSSTNAPTLFLLRAILIAVFAWLIFGDTRQKISFRQYKSIFMRDLFVITQWLLLYYALSKGNAGVVVTLANITPIFVFVLSIVFLREHPTLKKCLAAGLVLVLSLLI